MEDFVHVADNIELWTCTEGQGEPVVLLNGGPGFADYLGPVSALLSDSYTVHRYEPRGCGRSAQIAPFTLSQALTDLEMLRHHWGYERWIVVGHSWGADLALAYALDRPEAVAHLWLWLVAAS